MGWQHKLVNSNKVYVDWCGAKVRCTEQQYWRGRFWNSYPTTCRQAVPTPCGLQISPLWLPLVLHHSVSSLAINSPLSNPSLLHHYITSLLPTLYTLYFNASPHLLSIYAYTLYYHYSINCVSNRM